MGSDPAGLQGAHPPQIDDERAARTVQPKRSHKKLWWALAGIIVVLGLIALPIFQPWKLFVDQTVNESLPGLPQSSAAPTPVPPTGSAASSGGNPVATPPTPNATEGPQALAAGQFVSQEHETAGTATVYRLPDGQRVLRLSSFTTSNGPDVHVWLSDQSVRPGEEGWYAFDDGRHIDLGVLKGNIGDQNYVIPADVDLGAFQSVSIWCERFSVSFGAAGLTAT